MAKIERFEDIEGWKKGRELRKQVYSATRSAAFAKDTGLCKQIRRAAQSVTSNIAEGFERDGNNEFIHFLSEAKGSCGEVRDQLYTALDERYVDQKDFDRLYNLSVEVSRLIAGFMNYLKQSEMRGTKFVRNAGK